MNASNFKSYSTKAAAVKGAARAKVPSENVRFDEKLGKWGFNDEAAALAAAAASLVATEAKIKKLNEKQTAPIAQLPTKPAKIVPPKASKKAPVAPGSKGTKGSTYKQLAANRDVTSTIESPVFAMWELCNNMTESKRKDVIAAAVAKGINFYTARTQYQLWLTAYRNS